MDMNRIAIIDLGGQYTHLICQKVNKLGADGYIVHEPEKSGEIRDNTLGIILSGGPNSVYESDSPKVADEIFLKDIPILGICYGHQLLTQAMGGKVSPGNVREYGIASLNISTNNSMFYGIESSQKVWMSHGDSVHELPLGFEILASTNDCKFAAVGNIKKGLFGLQFHPEVSHTKCGNKILRNFLYRICKCIPKKERVSKISKIKEQILKDAGNKNIFFLVSGGVDSTVAFKLCSDTLGKNRVKGLCVDTGLMRKNEMVEINDSFKSIGLTNIKGYDASDIFLSALKGIHDPEKKRMIIGKKFLEVQNKFLTANNINENDWILGQGTIYPDTIESGGTKHSSLIKTHHNRVEAIERLKNAGKLIEPIASYYKDEVRELGRELNLPAEIVNRNPFPGPGLAIRCMTSNKEIKQLTRFHEVDDLFPQDNYKAWQLPQKTVGVQGDSRSESFAVVLEKNIPFKYHENVSTAITNNILSINRVTYLLGSKQPVEGARIVKRDITKERLDLLREADYIANNFISDKHISRKIWQFPVIIVPLQFANGETIVLRPISSTNGMTAEFTKIPKNQMMELTDLLLSVSGIDAVLYDITNKPPATIEWE